MPFKDRIPIRIKVILRPLARSLLAGPGIFAKRYMLEDNSRVTLYTDDATLLPDYEPRRSLREHLSNQTVRVSLIVSAKDEAGNVAQWCESILQQTRLPDEIIIVDAGSRDGTVETIERFAASSPMRFHVTIEPGANIARARNVAIAGAQYSTIAVTDFGCHPRPDWLQKIIAPFEADPLTQVVAGLYAPVDHRNRPAWRGYALYPVVKRINPQDFVPSSRSIAFTKQAWQAAGGYPEWLTLTGEDTFFDRELKRHGGVWAFVPEARVEWHAPDNFVEYCRKVFRWAQGDGESGLHASFYWRYVLQVTAALGGTLALVLLAAGVVTWQITPIAMWLAVIAVVWCVGLRAASWISGVAIPILFPEAMLEIAHIAGFVAGAKRRNAALQRRLSSVKGMFFILSGVPVDDTGGGARCTQITLELLRQGFAVVFINKFPRYESQDLKLEIGHPNLFTYSLSEFRWGKFLQREGQHVEGKLLAAIIEFPLGDFLLLVRKIRERGGIIVYDLLDAWDTSLGGQWYSQTVEKQIIDSSQLLMATVPALVERLERMSGRRAFLLPNAVNHRLFDPERHYERPADLPIAEWTAIYTGALWGEWLDWELLVQIARQYPKAAAVVIGDYHGQCRNAPSNLFFLGLKAQRDLPAYLAHANVAIIPWKVNSITQATSPLKVYEYLAMRLPVVAPDLAPLRDVPGVYLAQDAPEFVGLVERARQEIFPESSVARFIDENNWRRRVDVLNIWVGQMAANSKW